MKIRENKVDFVCDALHTSEDYVIIRSIDDIEHYISSFTPVVFVSCIVESNFSKRAITYSCVELHIFEHCEKIGLKYHSNMDILYVEPFFIIDRGCIFIIPVDIEVYFMNVGGGFTNEQNKAN